MTDHRYAESSGPYCLDVFEGPKWDAESDRELCSLTMDEKTGVWTWDDGSNKKELDSIPKFASADEVFEAYKALPDPFRP